MYHASFEQWCVRITFSFITPVLTVCRILLYLVLCKVGNLGTRSSPKCSCWGFCRTLTFVQEPIRVYEENKLHQDSLASIHWPQRRGFKGFGGFCEPGELILSQDPISVENRNVKMGGFFFLVRGLTTSKLMDFDILLCLSFLFYALI